MVLEYSSTRGNPTHTQYGGVQNDPPKIRIGMQVLNMIDKSVYSQFAPLPIRPSNQLVPLKYVPSRLSSVTSQTFGGDYLLVPGNQLNKQQLTTTKFGRAKLEG